MRILLLADSHLGFDHTDRPRVHRRRRGEDFFRCWELALAPALRGEVDAVVHGGDLFYRSRISTGLAEDGYRLLHLVANRGIPVLIVPGNHERSALPFPLLIRHPRIHVFDRPRTFVVHARAMTVAFSGFPCERDDVRRRFPAQVEATGWRGALADARLLCIHQAVEGAAVGHPEFVFRDGRDVIRTRDIPDGFAAVLCGHIHRHQVLLVGSAGRVIYPGSIERTSFAERHETKGYVIIDLPADGTGIVQKFVPLPARPMADVTIGAGCRHPREAIEDELARLPRDAVVRVCCAEPDPALTSAWLRSIAPPTMNVSFARRDASMTARASVVNPNRV